MVFPLSVDWSRPWYAPLRDDGLALAAADDWRVALNATAAARGLHSGHGRPLAFVPQQALPPGQAYESFIAAHGQVPTRENFHDAFNALVWLAFPRIKARLNALQAEQIARAGDAGGRRGPLRDAATLFDENAALVVLRAGAAGGALAQALRAHRWQELLVERAGQFGRDWTVLVFGHALLEKLAAPYKAITAHAWLLSAPDAFFALPPRRRRGWLDAAVAARLTAALRPADFTPLPLLGLPGWSADQDAAFYADRAVFRPPRQPRGEQGRRNKLPVIPACGGITS